MSQQKPLIVAVAGNPNCGKSTLINAIAGSRLHVGNWPGVTVEKKEALFDVDGRNIRLVDLPGCYSLSPYSQEEIITRDYLVTQKPDLIINVVDATNLERNLYLTMQLLELGIPMIMALNIYDEAKAKGYKINISQMEETLGISVIPTSATKMTGLDQLLKAVVADKRNTPRTLNYGEDIETVLAGLRDHLQHEHASLLEQYPQRWLLLKLLEGDSLVLKTANIPVGSLPAQLFEHLLRAHGDDIEGLLADTRYALSSGLCREVLAKPEKRNIELTEKIDRIVLNRFLGIPIFAAAMWLLFKLTFDLSSPFGDWIDEMTNGPFKRWVAAILGSINAPDWTVSLVNDGVIAGVGSVLVFVPVIFTIMFFITFLEGSGYMARAAFVMDRAMHAIGLHGKSFIPMLLGFGCNVPGIYATRTLENQKDKILTALLIPLMSCGARLPVYVLFAGVFFPNNSGTVIWILYIMGMLLAVLMGFIFKKTLFRGEAPMFIMELPPYRMPSFTSLCLHTWEKGKHFLIKAGTYIFAVSVLVWFMLNLPWGVEHKRDSYLGKAGAAIAPVFQPVGFGTWEAASSLITGVIAKEIVVGTMGEIYAPKKEEEKKEQPTLGEDLKDIVVSFGGAVKKAVSTLLYLPQKEEPEEEQSALKTAFQGQFTPLTSFSFMAFVLLYMPCVVVGAAMRQEFGTWKWAGVAFVYSTVLAWLVALIIYQGGRFLGLGG
ncbi:MAG: ferrous iron transport protein B [Trichlorobacter sp.]|uniref:ferrous iron transport protein B n=1 Tax=Trichlorobacter sp. TaxID=2911007 RepID=UPI002563033C|nr:ferrous iron transport protein B [Trichlorobacter sp.]MDK9719166.1 ferrous iron transport protein B [Trichlorobacter sp.]